MTARKAGPLLYGVLWVAVLPFALLLWTHRLDRLLHLPPVVAPLTGAALTIAGVALLVSGALSLWTEGGGLPMSPFPPQRLVTVGVYRLLADPLYVGAVMLTAGLALQSHLPAGIWITAPLLALLAASFVQGYERDATRGRFGAVVTPLLRLPGPGPESPTPWERLSVVVLVLGPWLLAYQAIRHLVPAADAWDSWSAFDARIPVVPWTESFYVLTYAIVILAPLAAGSRDELRRFALRGIGATVLIALFWLLVPVATAPRPVVGDGLWTDLMRWERQGDRRMTSFPAFHVVWPCIAATLYAARWPRLRDLVWALVVGIAVSCLTTGMHSIADVLAGFVAFAVVANGAPIWRAVLDVAERIANSWRELPLGPVRFMSHGVWAGLGGVVGLLVAMHLAGPAVAGWLIVMAVVSVTGAGLWAQLVEGSPMLLRPFGYFGGAFGGLAVAAIAGLLAPPGTGWRLLASFVIGAGFAQAIGRLRCLVQGCCHGRRSDPALGIIYRHPRSRVLRIADLGGVSLHPAPLYSAIIATTTGLLLWRLWSAGAPLEFIAGAYFVLIGAGRFVEEHFRGEPQTAWIAGLRLYQWLAIGFVVLGGALMAAGATAAPAPVALDGGAVSRAVLVGLFCYAAFGMDFPRSNARFARLTQ